MCIRDRSWPAPNRCAGEWRCCAARTRARMRARTTTSGGHYNDQMRAVRYVYVLALVVWLGGMVVLGAVVAPATFQVLQASEPATGRELGGAVFTTILERFHYIAYGAGALLLITLALTCLAPYLRPRHLKYCRPVS